jgi:hypothetical protein
MKGSNMRIVLLVALVVSLVLAVGCSTWSWWAGAKNAAAAQQAEQAKPEAAKSSPTHSPAKPVNVAPGWLRTADAGLWLLALLGVAAFLWLKLPQFLCGAAMSLVSAIAGTALIRWWATVQWLGLVLVVLAVVAAIWYTIRALGLLKGAATSTIAGVNSVLTTLPADKQEEIKTILAWAQDHLDPAGTHPTQNAVRTLMGKDPIPDAPKETV